MSGWGAAAAGAIDALKGGQAKNDQIELNERQMEYQTKMSNTAHQRQVNDLKLAGLNPILSSNSGASAPAGNAGGAQQSPTSIDVEAVRANIENTKANTAAAKASEQATKQTNRIKEPAALLADDAAEKYKNKAPIGTSIGVNAANTVQKIKDKVNPIIEDKTRTFNKNIQKGVFNRQRLTSPKPSNKSEYRKNIGKRRFAK